jgi:DNA-binding ferritin-like protein
LRVARALRRRYFGRERDCRCGAVPSRIARRCADPAHADDEIPKSQDVIRHRVEGQETVARTAREVFKAAEGARDQPTCDLLTQRMQVHEKTAWMLGSLLE